MKKKILLPRRESDISNWSISRQRCHCIPAIRFQSKVRLVTGSMMDSNYEGTATQPDRSNMGLLQLHEQGGTSQTCHPAPPTQPSGQLTGDEGPLVRDRISQRVISCPIMNEYSVNRQVRLTYNQSQTGRRRETHSLCLFPLWRWQNKQPTSNARFADSVLAAI